MEEEQKPHMIYDEDDVEEFIRPRVGMPGYGSDEDEQLASDEEWDWEADENTDKCLCLFAEGSRPTVEEAVAADEEQAGFNLPAVRKALGLDFYDTIRLVNYVRKQVAANKGLDDTQHGSREEVIAATKQASSNLEALLPRSLPFWKDDSYLIPVVAEDAMLTGFEDDEEMEEAERGLTEDEVELAQELSQLQERLKEGFGVDLNKL